MRIVVVGAGLAGLIASITLSRAGAEVLRIDRAAAPGGRARSLPLNPPEDVLNLGPRALYRGAALHRALRSFGVEPRGFAPPARGAWALLGGELVGLPGSLTDLLGASFLDARSKRALALALARVTVGALDADEGMSIGAWLDHHGGPPRARALLATLLRVATYSCDETMDAPLALRQLRRALTRGVLYVDGGWQALVDPLAQLAGTHAQRDVHALDDLDADRIILALPAAETRALVAGLPEAPPPVTASCLDLLLTSLPEPRRRVCFGVDAPLYFSVHTAPGEAPLKVHAMANGAASRAELEAFVDVVQPGWRDRLVEGGGARYLSRMVVASSLSRAGARRTPLTLDGRTFFAGDHVDCGELLADASAASAVRAARAVLDGSGERAAA